MKVRINHIGGTACFKITDREAWHKYIDSLVNQGIGFELIYT